MQGFTLRSWDEHTGQGLAQEFDDAANVQDGKVLTAGDVVPYHQSNSVFDWQCRYVGALGFDMALPFLLGITVTVCKNAQDFWQVKAGSMACRRCAKKFKLTLRKRCVFGFGCPACFASKGEAELTRVLEDLQSSFEFQLLESQQSVRCADIGSDKNRELRYDRVIMYMKRRVAIEFDGQQHFVAGFGRESCQSQVHLDRCKDRQSLYNGTAMLRICYQDMLNIEEWVLHILSKASHVHGC